MKIALVTRRYPPLIGGAERILSYLAPALAAEGSTVRVVTARPPGFLSQDEPSGVVPVDRLPTSRLRFVGTWAYLRGLRRWFARERVDLAYVSMLKHDAFAAIGSGRRLGFPVVLRPEGAGATGDLAWQRWGRFGRVIGRRCRQADAVVAISAAVHSELLAEGYDPAKIHDLPNGVPVPAQPWRPGPNRHHAGFVGRLAPEKGLDVLVDAWHQVVQTLPDARLTLIGDGPERPGLQERIAERGLARSIHLAGASTDPGSILSNCDLFVLPSREEGMSLALLEAMALGLPVVASAIPGNRGLIEDGIQGRLARPEDPGDLARVILAAWADPVGSARMAETARRRVVDHYSIESMARRHLDLFAAIIAGYRPGSRSRR